MIPKLLIEVFKKGAEEVGSKVKNTIASHVSVMILETFKKSISAKTIVRHYEKYVEGKKGINLNATKNSIDLYCNYLGYKNYSDFLLKNQNENPSDKITSLPELQKINYTKEDTHHEWMVYEVAFLWYDLTPPGIEAHFHLMDRDMEKKKEELHNAINTAKLEVRLEIHFAGQGYTRFVTREALLKYAKQLGEKPKFLFKEAR